ncbi:MAG: hypothetical protein OEW83_14905 [Acidimicrobiia bacterium]|nr:hypothetical protein [Acidimicrobiia bacterium]
MEATISRTDPVETIPNQGGSMEGHTPRCFARSGAGLFAGDNLIPGFPDGDGVQIWLTFDLPDNAVPPIRAMLRSDAMSTSGDPFIDLGEPSAAPVTYDESGPELYELEPVGSAVNCERIGSRGIECDVTASLVDNVEAGGSTAQFRLRYDL